MKNLIFRLCLFFVLCLTYLGAADKFDFDFEVNNHGWVGEFADYPVGEEAFYELNWAWTTLPAELPHQEKVLKKGLLLSGNNHSDDLFMFIKKPMTGLKPNTEYEVHFTVLMQNNIAAEQMGVGGSPGESVYFKVGASTMEPEKVDQEGFYHLNVNKGDQAQAGDNALMVGTIGNSLVDGSDPQFLPKEFVNEAPLSVKSDSEGKLWLFVGTDSAFESSTLYYIANITVLLQPKTP